MSDLRKEGRRADEEGKGALGGELVDGIRVSARVMASASGDGGASYPSLLLLAWLSARTAL